MSDFDTAGLTFIWVECKLMANAFRHRGHQPCGLSRPGA